MLQNILGALKTPHSIVYIRKQFSTVYIRKQLTVVYIRKHAAHGTRLYQMTTVYINRIVYIIHWLAGVIYLVGCRSHHAVFTDSQVI